MVWRLSSLPLKPRTKCRGGACPARSAQQIASNFSREYFNAARAGQAPPLHFVRAGFTLIEILIVMVIISIVAGVAMMTINVNHRKQYETLAAQLSRVITLAEQEAMLRPATIGLGISSQSYQFFIFARDAKTHKTSWQPITQTGLDSRKLPSKTQISLQVSGQTAPADGTPQIIITASGDVSPFVIFLGTLDESPYYQVIGKANGEVTSARYHAE